MQFRQIWESQRELRLARRVRSIADDRLDVLVLNAGISKAALIAIIGSRILTISLRQTFAARSFLVQQLSPF